MNKNKRFIANKNKRLGLIILMFILIFQIVGFSNLFVFAESSEPPTISETNDDSVPLPSYKEGGYTPEISAPTIIDPKSSSITNKNTLTVKWGVSGFNQSEYKVQVASDYGFSQNSDDSGWVKSSSDSYTYIAKADGTWYVRVKVKDQTGEESNWSSPVFIELDTIKPDFAAPKLTNIGQTSVTITNKPFSDMGSSSGYKKTVYYIHKWNGSNWERIDINGDGSTEYRASYYDNRTSLKVNNLEPETKYHYTVIHYDKAGNIGLYVYNEFYTASLQTNTNPTEDPTPASSDPKDDSSLEIVSPSDGSATNKNAPSVKWDVSGYTQSEFKVQLTSDIGFSQNLDDTGWVVSSADSYTLNNKEDGTWFVRVKIKDKTGAESDWSTPVSFAIDTIKPDNPVANVINIEETSATITINAFSDTGSSSGYKKTAFYMHKWNGSNWERVDIDGDGSTEYRASYYDNRTNLTVNNLEPETRYRYTVIHYDNARNLGLYTYKEFYTASNNTNSSEDPSSSNPDPEDESDPAANDPVSIIPKIIGPKDGSATNKDTPTIIWEMSGYSQSEFKVQIASNIGFSQNLEVSGWVVSVSNSYTVNKKADGTWYVRVKLKDQAGVESDWSSPTSFIIDTIKPNYTAPQILNIEETSVTISYSPFSDEEPSSGYKKTTIYIHKWNDDYWDRIDIDGDGSIEYRVSYYDNGTSITVNNLEPGAKYHYAVLHYDNAGNLGLYEYKKFYAASDPTTTDPEDELDPSNPDASESSVPKINDPVGGSATNKNATTVTWELSGYNQSEFQVQLASDGEFSQVLDDTGWIVSSSDSYTFNEKADGIWYVRVKLKDQAGVESEWSSPIQFVIDTIKPDNAEANINNVEPTSATITNNAFSDSFSSSGYRKTAYYIHKWNGNSWEEIDIDSDGSSEYRVSYYDNSTSLTVNNLEPETKYRYTAIHYDNANNLGRYLYKEFLTSSSDTNSSPIDGSAPIIIGLKEGSAIVESSPKLSWDGPFDTQSYYQLQIASDINFSKDLDDSGWLESVLNWHLVKEKADGTWYVRVKVKDQAAVESEWSITVSFAIDTISPNDLNAQIVNNGYNSVTITLDPFVDPEQSSGYLTTIYIIDKWTGSTWEQIDINSDLETKYDIYYPDGSIILHVDNRSSFEDNSSSLTVNNLEPGTKYKLMVSRYDKAGNRKPDIKEFSTPVGPVITYPYNSSISNENSPTVTWEILGGTQTEFQVQVSSKSGFSVIEEDTGWIISSLNNHTLSSKIDGIWYIRVKVKDQLGVESDWSPIESYFIDSISPKNPNSQVNFEQNIVVLTHDPFEDAGPSSGFQSTIFFIFKWNGEDWELIDLDGDGETEPAVIFNEVLEGFTMDFLEPTTKYKYDVTYIDKAGNTTELYYNEFTTPTPINGNEPVFSWGVVDNQTEYQVQVSSKSDFSVIEEDTGWVVSSINSHKLSPKDDGIWYARFRLKDSAGVESVWSTPLPVIIDTVPPNRPKQQVADIGYDYVIITNDPFSDPGPSSGYGITSYYIYKLNGNEWEEIDIASDGETESGIYVDDNSTSFTFINLEPGTLYAIDVTHEDNAGNESEYNYYEFETLNEPNE